MARRTKHSDAYTEESFGVPEFTLESILEECRGAAPEPETDTGSGEEPAYEPSVSEEAVYEKTAYEEPADEETAYEEPAYEEPVDEEPAYEEPLYDEPVNEEPAYEQPLYDEPVNEDAAYEEPDTAEETEEANFYGQPDMDESIVPDAGEDAGSAPAEPYEENFEDDASFYAPPAEAPDESPEEDAEEEDAGRSGKRKKRKDARRPSPGGLWGKIVGRAAAVSLRRANRLTEEDPEPEDAELEMPPRRAAKFYSAQMQSLRLRFYGACAVCLLLAWISIFETYGLSLPGALGTVRGASLVCLAGMFTVMLLGLDIVTAGIMSIVRGRFGAESMIVTAALAAVLDVIYMTASGDDSHGVTFAAVPAAAVAVALRGAWHSCRAYTDTFLAVFHAKDACAVTTELLPGEKKRVIIRSNRPADGFVRRSEEPSGAELLSSSAFLPMVGISLLLAVAVSIAAGDIRAVLHLFSLFTALCASFGWTLSFPLLFARTARHLMTNGSAIAGWSGARDVGRSGRLVLTDTDIFPEDTVEITGVRILDKSHTDGVVAIAGSMLAEAGTCTAAAFAELMRRRKVTALPVKDFTVGEGGAKGTIENIEVLIGALGFMHLNGVKIPDKLKEENALYVAVSGELEGVFLLRYRPMASIQRALAELRREHRKPIFAIRDFNIDPLLLQKTFGISTEGFRFPSFEERYRISSCSSSTGTQADGVMAQEGLDTLVDFAESGLGLYFCSRFCTWSAIASTVLGAVISVAPALQGNWDGLSAGRILLYMLLWLVVPLTFRQLLRK